VSTGGSIVVLVVEPSPLSPLGPATTGPQPATSEHATIARCSGMTDQRTVSWWTL